ncbi:hypothetical protein MMC20_005489 [Loxospora ochrophaea]|nr:hypothetical protein [Loxospora ochrophaea]
MSLDLWKEFASVPEDSKTPWPGEPSPNRAAESHSKGDLILLSSDGDARYLNPRQTDEQLSETTTDLFDQALSRKSDAEQVSYDEPGEAETWGDFVSSQMNKSLKSVVEPQTHIRDSRVEVLFDATAEHLEEDEFGDFAAPEPQLNSSAVLQVQTSPVRAKDTVTIAPTPSLIDLGLTPSEGPYPQPPKSPSSQEPYPFADLSIATIPASAANEDKGSSPVTAWPSYVQPRAPGYKDSPQETANRAYADDEWGEFVDFSDQHNKVQPEVKEPHLDHLSVGSPLKPVTPPIFTPVKDSRNQTKTAAQPQKSIDAPPPSNVPPPSILISLVTTLVQNLATRVKDSLSSKGGAPRAWTQSDLIAILSTVKVASRIVAGRKNRWKRDTHLSQSMKIGPAASGKTGGMKLTSVDRAQTLKEDREAAELVRTWKQHSGSIRAAVAPASAQVSQLSPLSDVSENMPVRIASAKEGALPSPKCCFLCGLNRNERVVKVDFEVEDTFREWWIDHWGHQECCTFWEQHENDLRQR